MTTTVINTQLTLTELANRKDPDGSAAKIAEVLAQSNPILRDAPWTEANDTFSHRITRRLTLPTGTWRRINQGVSNESSQTIPVVETIGMLESYSEVDKTLVDASPNPKQFRMQEASAFLEGMSQTLASAVVYGNAATDPEKITGLAPRMPDLDADGNVIGASGTGSDLTSIYVVQWGLDKVHFVYPKGHANFGINHQDLGEVTLQDTNGKNFQGYRDHFESHVGLVVRDSRSIARVANIEFTGGSNEFDEDDLIDILAFMPNEGMGASIYCNKYIWSQMWKLAKDKTNINYTLDSGNGLSGGPVTMFAGHPVRKLDANTVAEVVLPTLMTLTVSVPDQLRLSVTCLILGLPVKTHLEQQHTRSLAKAGTCFFIAFVKMKTLPLAVLLL